MGEDEVSMTSAEAKKLMKEAGYDEEEMGEDEEMGEEEMGEDEYDEESEERAPLLVSDKKASMLRSKTP